MEKVCSVCGAPMIRTEKGYKCSFCAHSELLGEGDPYEKSNKWTSYTSYTETEEPGKEMPQNDSPWNAMPREEAQPMATLNDVMVEVPMGNEPKVFELPEQPKQAAKNKPIWKKIIKFYVIVMVAQAVIPLLFFVFSGIGKGLFRDRDDFEITIDKSKFPVIHQVEVPDVDFEMPEIEVIMPDVNMPDFSYLDNLLNEKTTFASLTIPAVLQEMFGKPAEEVTKEEFQSIQYFALEIDYFNRVVMVQYSTEDYSLYPEDYREAIDSYEDATLGYNDEFEQYIHVIEIPFEPDTVEDMYADMVCFENVKALKIFEDTFIDLSAFPKLTMLDTQRCDVEDLITMNMPVEQIEVLRISSDSLDGLDKLINLKNLHVDGLNGWMDDLSVLSNMPWLEELTIAYTDIMDVDFLNGIPALKSLRLLYNIDLEDISGLESLMNVENLIWG